MAYTRSPRAFHRLQERGFLPAQWAIYPAGLASATVRYAGDGRGSVVTSAAASPLFTSTRVLIESISLLGGAPSGDGNLVITNGAGSAVLDFRMAMTAGPDTATYRLGGGLGLRLNAGFGIAWVGTGTSPSFVVTYRDISGLARTGPRSGAGNVWLNRDYNVGASWMHVGATWTNGTSRNPSDGYGSLSTVTANNVMFSSRLVSAISFVLLQAPAVDGVVQLRDMGSGNGTLITEFQVGASAPLNTEWRFGRSGLLLPHGVRLRWQGNTAGAGPFGTFNFSDLDPRQVA